VVFIVAKRVNNLCKETAFNKPNLIIGGLIGLLKGTVISVLFTFFVGFCIALTGKGFLIFTNDALESSYICKFILETFSRLINGGLSL
jgi:hypothetical protein